MGIVKKQGIQSGIIIYLGFLLGAVNVLYFFPRFFTPEEFGLTRVLLAAATTFAQFAMLGTVTVMLKFFPFYRDYTQKERSDFLSLFTFIPLIGYVLMGIVIWVFKDKLLIKYVARSPLFVDYAWLVYVTALFLVLYNVLETYSINLFKTVLPNFFRELGIRLFTTLLIFAFVLHWLNFDAFVIIYSLYYLIAFVVLLIYLQRLNEIHYHFTFSTVTKRLRKRMANYGGFVFGGGVLYVIAENLDTMMIAGISGLESTAVFAVASYVTQVIQVPQKSIKNITYPILAKAWKDRNMKSIEELYRKTAINQFVAACFLFAIIWVNIDELFTFLPETYAQGKYVVLVMALGKIIDMGTGINAEILETSDYWRVNFLLYVSLIALTIPLNYVLIYKYGIMGSAYTNFIAFTAYNLMRGVFIWYKYKLQPFSWGTLWMSLATVGVVLAMQILPDLENVIIQVFLQSIIISGVFLILILRFKISEDMYTFGLNIIKKVTGKNE